MTPMAPSHRTAGRILALLALACLVGAPSAAEAQEGEGEQPTDRAADECVLPGPPHPNMSEADRKLMQKAMGTSAVDTVTYDGRQLLMARVGDERFARWNCRHDLLLVVERRRNGPAVKLRSYTYADEYTVTRWRLWMQEGIGPTSGGRRGDREPGGR